MVTLMTSHLVGGPQDVVAKDVQSVLNLGHVFGINLNTAKCEIITHPDGTVTDPTLLSFVHIQSSDAELLGAPLFPGSALDAAWTRRCKDLARAVDRLVEIRS